MKKLSFSEKPLLRLLFLSTSFFFFTTQALQAQIKYDYEWLMGYQYFAGEGPPPKSTNAINKISFHSQPPDTFRTDLTGSAGIFKKSNICNSRGELIYYSNGCRVYHPDGTLMEGGEVLIPGPLVHRRCDGTLNEWGRGSIQSMVSLPMDRKDSLFFLIHMKCDLTHQMPIPIDEPYGQVCYELFLSRIVQHSEGHYYIPNEAEVIVDEIIGLGEFIAVRSDKPNYWWLIVPPHVHMKNYRVIGLGPQGVDTIITTKFDYDGFPFNPDWVVTSGQPSISPDGNTYVRWVPEDTVGILLFDFDRTSGQLSNIRHIEHPEKESWSWESYQLGGGSAISPNGRFLYINTADNLYQYDLLAENVAASMVHIDSYDDHMDSPVFPSLFFLIQQGPNCKMYMTSQNTVQNMHVINEPNLKGKACDFRQREFKLPGRHHFTPPYHPHYRLDSEYPLCDSTLTNVQEPDPGSQTRPRLFLYPNPAVDYTTLEWRGMEPTELRIFDLSGRELFHSRVDSHLPEFYLPLDDFRPGVYLISVRDREGRQYVERLVVQY